MRARSQFSGAVLLILTTCCANLTLGQGFLLASGTKIVGASGQEILLRWSMSYNSFEHFVKRRVPVTAMWKGRRSK